MVAGLEDSVAATKQGAERRAVAVLESAVSSPAGETVVRAANDGFAALLNRRLDGIVGRSLAALSADSAAAAELMALLDAQFAEEAENPAQLHLAGVPLRCDRLTDGRDRRFLTVTGTSGPAPRHGGDWLHGLMEEAGLGIGLTDAEGRIIEASAGLSALLGDAPDGLAGEFFRRYLHPEDAAPVGARLRELLTGARGSWRGACRLRRGDGLVLGVRMAVSAIIDPGRPEASLAILLEAVRETAQAHRGRHVDAATGLPDAGLFEQRADNVLIQAEPGRTLPLLVIGFDPLPVLLLSLERGDADRLLLQIAGRLRDALGRDAVLGRLGDATFGALLTDIEAQGALKAAQSVLDAFVAPFPADQRELAIGPILGVSLFPRDGLRTRGLIRAAGAALQQSREQPTTRCAVFEPDMAGATVARLSLEGRLRRAIERNEFEVRYQPTADAKRLNLAGFEALVRWRPPEGESLSPTEFIPVAENSGLILPLGELVLETACRDFAAWRAQGLLDLPVSVNLSGRQLADPQLCRKVLDTLERHGVPPDRLKFELTETVLFGTTGSDRETLVRLHEAGIGLLLDDFGTGYSSLGYLNQFPIEAIKIDRSFIKGIGADTGVAPIVRAMIDMAHALGIEVIAEGVETPEELAFLRAQGCDRVQGFLISKAVPPDRVGAILRERKT